MTPGGLITTVAGNGTAGYSGDGGPATAAALNAPEGLVIDSVGNLYIADQFNRRIRKVSNGIITTVAGNGLAGYAGDGGPSVTAELSGPAGISLDAAGNLYIADRDNNRIRVLLTNGTIWTVAGNGSAACAGDGSSAVTGALNSPRSVPYGPEPSMLRTQRTRKSVCSRPNPALHPSHPMASFLYTAAQVRSNPAPRFRSTERIWLLAL